MKHLIDKSALVAEIERRLEERQDARDRAMWNDDYWAESNFCIRDNEDEELLTIINTLEVKDLYEHLIQYSSIEAAIKAHAEDYSFNIESELFNQLTKEQQVLWRKEIEQACISGGYCGLNLQKDSRYDDNLEVKDVDLEKEYEEFVVDDPIFGHFITNDTMGIELAKHFFELGLKAR